MASRRADIPALPIPPIKPSPCAAYCLAVFSMPPNLGRSGRLLGRISMTRDPAKNSGIRASARSALDRGKPHSTPLGPDGWRWS